MTRSSIVSQFKIIIKVAMIEANAGKRKFKALNRSRFADESHRILETKINCYVLIVASL